MYARAQHPVKQMVPVWQNVWVICPQKKTELHPQARRHSGSCPAMIRLQAAAGNQRISPLIQSFPHRKLQLAYLIS